MNESLKQSTHLDTRPCGTTLKSRWSRPHRGSKSAMPSRRFVVRISSFALTELTRELDACCGSGRGEATEETHRCAVECGTFFSHGRVGKVVAGPFARLERFKHFRLFPSLAL